MILQEDSSVSTVNGELVGVGHAINTGKGWVEKYCLRGKGQFIVI